MNEIFALFSFLNIQESLPDRNRMETLSNLLFRSDHKKNSQDKEAI